MHQANGQEDVIDVAAQDSSNENDKEEIGKGIHDIGKTHHQVIEATPAQGGQAAKGQPEANDDSLSQETYGQRGAGPVDDAAQLVAAQGVGPEEMLPAWTRLHDAVVLQGGVIRSNERSEEGYESQSHDEHEASPGHAVPGQPSIGIGPRGVGWGRTRYLFQGRCRRSGPVWHGYASRQE